MKSKGQAKDRWVGVITAALVIAVSTLADGGGIGSARAAGPSGPSGSSGPPPTQEQALPNIMLLVTDDQRADTLQYMDNVQRLLVNRGVRFSNGYVVNPVCCPSRASLLTGGYSHTTGVYTNHSSLHGGFRAFRDDSTIATWLHDAGYRTALLGKYLNGYGRDPYVPPGWDRWFATFNDGGYYGYEAVSDGRAMRFGNDPEDYGTTVLRREAVSFIRETDEAQPFFMYLAPHAPHDPATPAPGDRGDFASLTRWRPRNYDERDLSDKPENIQRLASLDARTSREIDEFRLEQLRSLQSVDRTLAALVDTLRDTGRLENTIIVFTSDNGMFWGEHRLHGKSQIYEEAIEVPYVIRFDAMIDDARVDDHLVLNIDLAPTFAKLAGVEAPRADGRSLLPLLRSEATTWREAFLVEHMAKGSFGAPTFCAIHTDRFVFAEYDSGEEELYDLVNDPHQLDNVSGQNAFDDRRRELRSQLKQLCDPLPPGFSF